MRKIGCASMIFALLVSVLFCATAAQSSMIATAQIADYSVDPTTEPTATPIEVSRSENSTELGPTVTPIPTLLPTPGIDPGSPVSIGGASLEEELAQFDIISLAKMVLVILGVIWGIIILVTVVRRRDREKK